MKADVLKLGIDAIERALEYMPLVTSDVPPFQRQIESDIQLMKNALEVLRMQPRVLSELPTKILRKAEQ